MCNCLKVFYIPHLSNGMNCVICKVNDDQVMMLEENLLAISKCNNCGSIYSNFKENSKQIGSEDMIDAHNVKNSKMNFFTLARFLANRHVFKITSKFDTEYIIKNIDIKSVRTALDIGAQYGFLIENLSKLGMNISGVEAFYHPYSVTKKIRYDFFSENFDDHGKKYDLIVFGDVIQLMANPVKSLEKAISMLNENGHILITTINPNFEGIYDFITRTKNYYMTFIGKRGFELISEKNNCSIIRFESFRPKLYIIKTNWTERLKVGIILLRYLLRIDNGFKENQKGLRNYILIRKN